MANRFSIAMCTYNGARFLREQLESIAGQTRRPDELVVCDDGSTDETVRLVEEFAATAPFPVRLHVNERNLGSTRNFEQAIALCTGDLVALSDQDDVWLAEKLERIEEEFERRAGTGLVFTDALVVDEELRPLGYTLWEKLGLNREEQRRISSGRALDILLTGWTVTGATMAFRARYSELFIEIPEDLMMIHDGWIALVVAAVSNVVPLNEPLVKYRQHARQQIGAPKRAAGERASRMKNLGEIRKAISRANTYAELIEIGGRLRQRLVERSDRFDSTAALERLDARLLHLRTRDRLPKRRLKRLRPVVRELMMRRYHLYSNGIYSAVKDLLTRNARDIK